MKRVLKLFLASLLTVSLSLATVICCCIAPSVIVHFHKTDACSHCSSQGAHNNAPNPAGACQNQLTSAEFLHSQAISTPNVSATLSPVSAFLSIHRTTVIPSILLAYPPGGPPLGISFTPLYLRTFNLRI
jgi:hypothetical protein